MAFRQRFFSGYLNPLEVEAEVMRIAAQFPELCRLETLPHLSHGYQGQRPEARGRHAIKVLRITAPGTAISTKPIVLLMRSHHAREWINPVAALETARQLVENFRPEDLDPEVRMIVRTLEKVEFMIIAETNPDGARLSFFDTGQRMWRKNLRPPGGSGCAGVDCNRNFPNFWGEAGSSNVPCAEIYHGPQPLSEPEAANIAVLVERFRNIIFAIDSHSHGQAIFRPSRTGGTFVSSQPVSDADDAIYRHLETKINDFIQKVQSIRYTTGSTSNHAGTTDEFFFFKHQIFGFDLECGTDFQPPISEALLASLEVAQAAKALGLCATGETGLDIDALLARRATPIVDETVSEFSPLNAKQSWKFKTPPAENFRRYLLECAPLDRNAMIAEFQLLADKGFDVKINQKERKFIIIAGEKEMADLRKAGYTLVLKKDFGI